MSRQRRASTSQLPARPDSATRSTRAQRYAEARRTRTPLQTWRALPWSMRILRAFLGVTFVFAGVQKFLDPNFLHPGGGDYIGTQLQGFAVGTPLGPLMRLLAHQPVAVGITIAIVEIAIGLGTLLGIAAIWAASAGFAISVTLWLSATWHVHPYFLGSDSIYAVAWLGLAVGLWEAEVRRFAPARVPGPIERIDGMGRREVLRGGLVAGIAVVAGLAARVAAAAPGPAADGLRAAGAGSSRGSGVTPQARTSPAATSPTATSAAPSPAAPAVRGKTLTTMDKLQVMQPVAFNGPNGVPAVLVRLPNDHVVAYSRVCTHAGCTVGYDASANLLVCPCHGAEFDPSRGASPVAGPTSTPLQPIRVVVDHASGDVILPR